jgi:Mg-chelatase subunit ChlD
MEKNSYRLAILLLAFSVGITLAGVSFYRSTVAAVDPPEPQIEQPENTNPKDKTLEMVFVLDTTGSMGGLLDGAKQKIWGIINDVMQKQSHPSVRVGLVAYRDKGDDYVTQVLPLTEDLDKVYGRLMDFQAGGGGDTPEDVRLALADGVQKAGWSPARKGLAQIIFLVGDAPPHAYENEPDVLVTTAEATRKNMIVNAIQCGNDVETSRIWNSIAQRGQGKFFAIAQDGGVETIHTPYDDQLSQLGQKIGSTYVAYGDEKMRMTMDGAAAKTESTLANTASNSARADRAYNKALNKDAYNGDLIQDIENGRTKLADIKTSDLPSDLQKMSPDDRQKEVEKRLTERKQIRDQIVDLSKQRDAYIEAERKKSGKQNGFDAAVASALAEQLVAKGIE